MEKLFPHLDCQNHLWSAVTLEILLLAVPLVELQSRLSSSDSRFHRRLPATTHLLQDFRGRFLETCVTKRFMSVNSPHSSINNLSLSVAETEL